MEPSVYNGGGLIYERRLKEGKAREFAWVSRPGSCRDAFLWWSGPEAPTGVVINTNPDPCHLVAWVSKVTPANARLWALRIIAIGDEAERCVLPPAVGD